MINTTNIVGNIVDLEMIQNSVSFLLKIVGGLVGLYVIYLIVTFITERVKNRKINNTYKNTEEILNKLERLEEKINRIKGKHKHKEEEHKAKKEKKRRK